MKIGTLSCWLFGHRFAWRATRLPDTDQLHDAILYERIGICTRCGINREDVA